MPGSVTVKGKPTKSTFLYGPEAHKLHLEFDLSPNPSHAAIHKGQPVKLEKITHGDVDYDCVVPAAQKEREKNIIGVSIHEMDSAYKGAIVVATRGYTVIYGKAGGAMNIGTPVYYDSFDNTDSTAYSVKSHQHNGYSVFKAVNPDHSEDYAIVGWVLETCAENDIVKILIKN